MFTFTFKGKSGKTFSAKGKDADRARSIAKAMAGESWDASARLISIKNCV